MGAPRNFTKSQRPVSRLTSVWLRMSNDQPGQRGMRWAQHERSSSFSAPTSRSSPTSPASASPGSSVDRESFPSRRTKPSPTRGRKPTHFGVVLSGTVTPRSLGDGGAAAGSSGSLKAGDTFGEMALMTGDTLLADFIAESRCEVLLIPVSLFQSVIVAEPGAVQHISRTIAERMKAILADPLEGRRRAAQERRSLRPHAEGRATGEDPRHQLRLVVAQVQLLRHRRSNPATRAAWSSASASTARGTRIADRRAR